MALPPPGRSRTLLLSLLLLVALVVLSPRLFSMDNTTDASSKSELQEEDPEHQEQDPLASSPSSSLAAAAPLPPLTFACVSDTHGFHNTGKLDVPPADVLLFAGDAGLEDRHDVERFESWLQQLPHRHKVVVMGNMDRAAAVLADKAAAPSTHTRHQLAAGAKPAAGASGSSASSCIQLQQGTVLHDKIQEVAGYRILGSPWTPAFFGQWQLADAAAAKRHWAQLLPPDADVDILVTHGPPHGYGDRSRGRHVGDKELLQAVQNLKKPPLLWVCGHIHESFGQHRVPHPRAPGGILLINAAVNNLVRGDAGAAPRSVQLPSGQVQEPPLQQQQRQLQQQQGSVWKGPILGIFDDAQD